MKNEKAPITGSVCNCNDIIPQNEPTLKDLQQIILNDFAKSGIPEETVIKLARSGYLVGMPDGWKLFYSELYENKPTTYYNHRHFNTPEGVSKYSKPKGECSRLFRPPMLPSEILKNTNEAIIIVEGEKKAIKGVLEGFNCIALSGVYAWKMKLKTDDDKEEDVNNLLGDVIPDIVNFDLKGRTIYLCYDNDMWKNPQVKKALYHLAAYLICERGATVKIIKLPNDDEKLGLDDFLIKYGKDEFKKLIKEAQTLKLKAIQNELSGKINTSIDFPLNVFDNKTRALILELQKCYDAPIEYIAVALLSCISILLDCRAEIELSKASSWVEPPVCWFAIVGEPSQKKTPCLKIAKRILDEYDELLCKEYERKMEVYNSDYAEYKVNLSLYKSGLKSGNGNLKLPIEPKKPLKPRLTTQDATTEALCYAVNANKEINRGVAVFSDELAHFFKGLNQYKKGGNDLEYFIQTWDKKPQNIVRQGGAIDYTIKAGHNIIGSIQPKVLDETLFSKGVDTTNGWIERWLFVCTEYTETGVLPEQNLNTMDINDFKKRCDRLFSATNETKRYYLSEQAYKCFSDFYKSVADLCKSDKLTNLMKNYLKKQNSYVGRFSLILHCMENPENLEISKNAVERAILLISYFVNCFKMLTTERIAVNSLEDYALGYMISRNITSISPTELRKKNISRFKTLEQAQIALENLADKGYGRIRKTGARGCKFLIHN